VHDIQRFPSRVGGYVVPADLDEALDLLARHGADARVVAGGTDLLVELSRRTRPDVGLMIDLSGIGDADRIEQVVDPEEGPVLRLGPLTTHQQVVASADAWAHARALAQACAEVGSPQLRNRATVVGNVVTASPANDTLSALVALGAMVEVRGPGGLRRVDIESFVTGVRTVDLAPDELVVAVLVPLDPHRRSLYAKVGLRRAQAISVVHAAVSMSVAEGAVTHAVVALGSVAPTIVRSGGAERALIGERLDREVAARVGELAAAAVRPIDDLRATADYRNEVAEVTVRRMLLAMAGARPDLEAEPDRSYSSPRLWGRTDGHWGAVAPATMTVDDEITVNVNGVDHRGAGSVGVTLLDWLRDRRSARGAWLTGTKEGCAEGECGACTVLLDGMAVMSCLVPASRAHGRDVVTVEGLASPDGQLSDLQQAMVDCHAVQCGFCTPGIVVAATALLDEVPSPGSEQICDALAGNLCRCTGYGSIIEAIGSAAATREARS